MLDCQYVKTMLKYNETSIEFHCEIYLHVLLGVIGQFIKHPDLIISLFTSKVVLMLNIKQMIIIWSYCQTNSTYFVAQGQIITFLLFLSKAS